MSMKSFSNMTTRSHTHFWKHRMQSQNSDGKFFPNHHTTSVLLSQISLSFGVFKDVIRVRRIEGDDEVTEEVKKWLRVQNSNCYKKWNICPSFTLLQGRWVWWRLCRNIRCVVHPYCCSASMFRELYDKLLTIKVWLCRILDTFVNRRNKNKMI